VSKHAYPLNDNKLSCTCMQVILQVISDSIPFSFCFLKVLLCETIVLQNFLEMKSSEENSGKCLSFLAQMSILSFHPSHSTEQSVHLFTGYKHVEV